ncbi:PQQ-binding-like beta-propeller repeat protein [Mariniphaga anaerophila]|nr:hypothetical protein [Mariniphaga anaerophila]
MPFFFVASKGFSQIPEVSWEKQFKINSSNYFSDVAELPGGDFILLGAIEKPDDRSFDIWIVKCNQKGDTLKSLLYKNPGNDVPIRIIYNEGKGYLVAFLNEMPQAKPKACILAVDSTLVKMWSVKAEQFSGILQTDVAVDNSGNIWWLNTFAKDDGKNTVSLQKMDDEGNKIDEFNFEGDTPSAGYSVRTLPDGTLGISCQVQPQEGNPTVHIIRMDSTGKTMWETTVPQNARTLTPQCLCCSPDNTILVGGWAGLCYNPDAPTAEQIWDYDYLLTKLSASGEVVWTQNYNREGSEKGTALAVLPNANIMAAGKCETSFSGKIGPWLLLIDKSGKMLTEKVFQFKFVNDQAARIICTSDGGFIMVGPGYIDTNYLLSGWVKKLSPLL